MKTLLLSAIALLPISAQASWNTNDFMRVEKNERPSRIVIENRVLANINNHPISVMDVMKKMDTHFYRDYPHLVDSDIARYQYYKGHWSYVFDNMVNNELICTDAKNRKVEVTHGDVRQEMDRLYGPQIITNLDKIGLSYEEAWDITEKDIYVRRMMGSILNLRGAFNTAPDDLLAAYQDYIQKNRKPDYWRYHILSFRGPNALENAQMAKGILEDLKGKSTKDFSTLSLLLKDQIANFESKEISISDEFNLKDTEISEKHIKVLEGMQKASFSLPFEEISRVDKKPLYRLFYLAEHIKGGKIEFAEVEDQLKEELIQSKVDEEISIYIASLRERFGITSQAIDDVIPHQFEPFMLR